MNDASGTPTPAKRIAAIDLGTNSFHALLVDIYPDGSFRPVDTLKEMVILTEKGMKNRLSEEAMNRGISALQKIKILCDSQGVERILAYTTSAIREAENGGEFMQRMIDEVQIKALPISGSKEAELIGQAIQHAVSIDDETVLMADIGGGSVEFILRNKEEVFYSASIKIGVARMAARFIDNDPITDQEIKKLEAHFKKELATLFKEIKDHPVNMIIGSSGTMENIAEMIANGQSETASITLNGLIYSTSEYKKFHRTFITLNRKERLNQKGLEEKRVDIITPGLVLLNFLIERCGIEQVKISESALREGMILDYIKKKNSLNCSKTVR